MISLENPELKNVEGVLDTPKKIETARKGLEEATEEDFRGYDECQRRAQSRYFGIPVFD